MELLLVITVIGVLAALAAGGLNNVARSSGLATAAQRLGDQIALARQSAASLNLPVEVRLYKMPDFDTTSGTPTLWRGLQLFSRDPAGNAIPLTKPVIFPNRVIISEDTTISPLMNSSTGLGGELTPANPVGGIPAASIRYKSFTIRPNATVTSTNAITSANSFLTLHQQNEPKPDGIKPANFITIQINPITSKVTLLRP